MKARIWLATFIVCASCAEKPAETPVDAAPAGATVAVATDVDRAVEISNALSAHPSQGDSILAAHAITAEQLESLMLKIAKDSVLSAEYGRRTTR